MSRYANGRKYRHKHKWPKDGTTDASQGTGAPGSFVGWLVILLLYLIFLNAVLPF